nr:hypothetical protein [Tanacetum cinerariifolium]
PAAANARCPGHADYGGPYGRAGLGRRPGTRHAAALAPRGLAGQNAGRPGHQCAAGRGRMAGKQEALLLLPGFDGSRHGHRRASRARGREGS